MESRLSDDQLKTDPFELSKESELNSSFTMFLRAFGYLTVTGYAVWALTLVSRNIGNLIKIEADALARMADLVNNGIGDGIIGWEPPLFIFICIWCAYYLIRIRRICFKVIVYRWKWIWVKVEQITPWGRIIRFFAILVVVAQFIFCICIYIVTFIVVWVNIRVLVGVIF